MEEQRQQTLSADTHEAVQEQEEFFREPSVNFKQPRVYYEDIDFRAFLTSRVRNPSVQTKG